VSQSVDAVSTLLEHPIVHVLPPGPLPTVARIAERLFPAYTLDGGRVHLAGCTLDDRLLVRVHASLASQPCEFLVDREGRDVDPTLAESLGVRDAVTTEKAPPLAARQLDAFLTHGLALVEQRLSTDVDFQLHSITAVWCRYVEGKLRFTFGEASADLPFADWAQTLVAPPFVCPYSGQRGFHLAATDDGRVTLAEQIARCEETGCRTLADDLVRCTVCGRRVQAELAAVCPVTGRQVLRRLQVACTMCGQQVSPTAIKNGRCEACRSLHAVDKTNPPLARLLAQHPELNCWRWWHAAETRAVHIFRGSGFLRQILIVADKDSFAIKRQATGNRLKRLPQSQNV
jgi:hypothetical protein